MEEERMPVPARRSPARKSAPHSRTAILKATEELLREQRVDELKVSQVVEKAGVSRATFYVHFDTKFSVVAALLQTLVDRHMEIWRPLFDGAGPIEELQIRAGIESMVTQWREHAALLTATVEGWHTDPEIHEAWSAMIADFAEALETRIRRADPVGAHVDVEGLAAALAALLERCIYLSLSTPDSIFARNDQVVIDTVTTIWSRSLGAA